MFTLLIKPLEIAGTAALTIVGIYGAAKLCRLVDPNANHLIGFMGRGIEGAIQMYGGASVGEAITAANTDHRQPTDNCQPRWHDDVRVG